MTPGPSRATTSRSQLLMVAVMGVVFGAGIGVVLAIATGWPWLIVVGIVLALAVVGLVRTILRGSRAAEWVMITAVVMYAGGGVLAVVAGSVGQLLQVIGLALLPALGFLYFRHLRRSGEGKWMGMQTADGPMPFSVRANSTQGRLGRGGLLTVSAERLTFTPLGVERALGARDVEIERADVVDVGVQPRTFDLLGGGLRRRLRVDLADSRRHLFVVDDLEQLVERLRTS